MPWIELPHTPGCLVCGTANARGMHLSLEVNSETGVVRVAFTPRSEHMGFEGIVHGGALATVFDEAMVWAATWAKRRFCVCGELTVRFRQTAEVGEALHVTAHVTNLRSRLIETSAEVHNTAGKLLAVASGKYVPMQHPENRRMVQTLIKEPATERAHAHLTSPHAHASTDV